MSFMNDKHYIIFFTSLLLATTMLNTDIFSSLLLAFLMYIALGGWKFARVFILTVRRDIKALYILLSLRLKLLLMNHYGENIYNLYEKTVERRGADTVAVLFEDAKWTFGQLKNYCDRVAHVYQNLGIEEGDNIGMLMESNAVYYCLWLAGIKLGAKTALFNFSLKRSGLQHCIDEVNPKVMIVSQNTAGQLDGVSLPENCTLLLLDDVTLKPENFDDPKRKPSNPLPDNAQSLDVLVANSPGTPEEKRTKKSNVRDQILFIFTSGTTGMPKAAIITNARYTLMSFGPFKLFNVNVEKDVLYTPLPLYHTAGVITGTGMQIQFGVTQAIRRKFSASNFWVDCIKYNCTIVQYIGEICRYLLVQPNRPEEKAHNVRLAYGNGMRKQIWTEFVERFGVEQIGEFYGATESNANFVNSENVVGAIGFSSVILPWAYPVYLIRMNNETEEPLRDPLTGLCIQCKHNEVGQLIGAIHSNDPIRSFDGYVSKNASSKKIISNVFASGDKWFLSGDALVQDELGYFYFKDRLGDTFRWKGENVSTNEVEAVISSACASQDCIVYGVAVPNCEGKAGMAAIQLQDAVDQEVAVKQMASKLSSELPVYAQPLFVRIIKHIPTTGTFKMRKIDVQKDGFDPDLCGDDPLYYLNLSNKLYEPLTTVVMSDINKGIMRL